VSDSEFSALLVEFRKLVQLLSRNVDKPKQEPPRVVRDEPIDNRQATQKTPKLPNESHDQWLRRCALIDEREGRGITMNSLARSVPKLRPPKRPSWAQWE
jgi:hypothetical protein